MSGRSGEPSTPGVWRVCRAILPLPFMATLVIPTLILTLGRGSSWDLDGVGRGGEILGGLIIGLGGIALFTLTVRLFATVGRGTLAPWDPPERLVVRGAYRYLRHPMISGVALVLTGETLLFESESLAIWLGIFVIVNACYQPLVEEPALVRRFGSDYERYMEHVPRWLPRPRPWRQ